MTIMASAPISSFSGIGANTSAQATTATQNEADSSDRFLKLLVAQMQNQDPLNPLDNAQVTSQMAQINTVTGIDKLNKTVQGLNTQFVQMQALQGASLVGRDVTVAGDRLAIDADGDTGKAIGEGAFELGQPADRVKLEILGPAGHVLDSVDLGAFSAGRHSFEWPAGAHGDGEGLRFRLTPMQGAAAVPVQTLMLDRVQAVSTAGDSLTLELARTGNVPYSAIKTFH